MTIGTVGGLEGDTLHISHQPVNPHCKLFLPMASAFVLQHSSRILPETQERGFITVLLNHNSTLMKSVTKIASGFAEI